MKHELGIAQPTCLVTDWPGKYDVFSWLEFVVTVPNPIMLVTTRKANGAPNANLHSWAMLLGDRDHYTCLLSLLDHTHTHANIMREGEWVLNYPSVAQYRASFETIYVNGPDNDEITEAGFTVEPAQTVSAPRIAECAVNVECRLEWQQPLAAGSRWRVFAGRVTHVALDDAALVTTPEARIANLGLMYNVRSVVNPLTGEQYGPNTLGLLGQVKRIFPDEGGAPV